MTVLVIFCLSSRFSLLISRKSFAYLVVISHIYSRFIEDWHPGSSTPFEERQILRVAVFRPIFQSGEFLTIRLTRSSRPL